MILIGTIVLIPILIAVLALKVPAVQTFIARRVAEYFSKEWNAEIKLDRFALDWGLGMHLEGFVILDDHQDTLMSIQDFEISAYQYNWNAGLSVQKIILSNVDVFVERREDARWNCQGIIDYLSRPGTDTSSVSWSLNMEEIDLRTLHVQFRDTWNTADSPAKGVVDWRNTAWDIGQLNLQSLAASNGGVNTHLKIANAAERMGYRVANIASSFQWTPNAAQIIDLHVDTERSHLTTSLSVKGDLKDLENWKNWNWQLDTKATPLQVSDFALLDKSFQDKTQQVMLDLSCSGNIQDVNITTCELSTGAYSRLDISGSLTDLLDTNGFSMNVDVANLQVDYDDVVDGFSVLNLDHSILPNNLKTLGLITYEGNVSKNKQDYRMYGDIQTLIGSVQGDIDLTLAGEGVYSGYLEMENFDLGKYYGSSELGPVTASLDVNGTGFSLSDMKIEVDGEIAELNALGYPFQGIQVTGDLANRAFEGELSVRDKNVELDFLGTVDFKGAKPLLNCNLDVVFADIKNLGLMSRWPYSNISGKAEVQSSGWSEDDFEGTVLLKDISYCTHQGDYILDYLSLEVARDEALHLNLNSDIAVGSLNGNFKVKDVAYAVENIIFSVVPSVDFSVRSHELQRFDLDINILDFSQISAAFNLGVGMSQQARLKLKVDERTSLFDCVFFADSIARDDLVAYGVVFDISKPDEFIYGSISCDSLYKGGKWMEAMSIDARAEGDWVYFDWVWGNEKALHAGDIGGKFSLTQDDVYAFEFYRGDVRLKTEKWQVADGSSLSFNNESFWFHDFGLISKLQSVAVNGQVSKSSGEPLLLSFSNVNFNSLNAFMPKSVQLNGTLDGTIALQSVLSHPQWVSNIHFTDFGINNEVYGDVQLESKWNEKRYCVDLKGGVKNNELTTLDFSGFYFPKDSAEALDINVALKDFNLGFIQSFVDSTTLDIDGLAQAEIKVTGSLADPQLYGAGSIRNGVIGVDYLKTEYYIDDKIWIEPERFVFQNAIIKDQLGNKGLLTGSIGHEQFQKWSFDILADLEKQPMRLLNTSEQDNPDYYGRANATGFFHLTGDLDNLGMTMAFKTAPGTKLNLPMAEGEEEELGQFIHFVSSKNVQSNTEQPMDLSGISLDIQIDVTPDAELSIIFDEAVGDVMKGRGTGHVSLGISKLATFDMYGNIEIASGSYLFTLKNLINKEFQIQPGGTIAWYGNPYEAELKLNALYKVNASLSDVLADQSANSGQRVPVDLVMNLNGKMLNPSVDFKIDLPSVDPMTKSRFESIVSTDQERNRQAFALLVLRQFVSPPNIVKSTNSATNNLFVENSTELLSSQISNWLSQISDDFNLGFNYRSGDQISNEEVALALSTQLFDNRMQLSGNFGLSRGNASNQQPSNYIGDVKVEYRLTEEGRLKLVAYNESNNYRNVTTQQSPYTQGVGIIYQEDFDRFMDLFKKRKKP